MKSKAKVTMRIICFITFSIYLVVTLAFSAGVSEKYRNEEGEFLPEVSTNEKTFDYLYNSGWENAESVSLILLTLSNVVSLLLIKKTRKTTSSLILGIVSCVSSLILFVLKMAFQNMKDLYITNELKTAMAFIRMLVIYITFYCNVLGKTDITKIFYRKYKQNEKYQEINNNNINNYIYPQIDRDNTISIHFTGQNNKNENGEEVNNNQEFVIINNISPLKLQVTPRKFSIKNEVSNKLPLILVEKVKIPKILNLGSNEEDYPELNNSEETKAKNSFMDEISVIYQNNYLNINERHNQMISELNRIPDITFNVFKLSEYSDGNELILLMSHLMYLYHFAETLQINTKKFHNYFYNVNKKYRKNSYHNSIHASDVTQTVYFLLKTCNIDTICNLNDLEIFSCFFASSIHDLDHPGNNNNYEIAVGSTLAISYNDKAVLENYHLAKAFYLLSKENCDFYENFSRTNYNISRAIIINMVLSTDMANHFLDLSQLRTRSKASDFDPAGAEKQLLLNQVIHASDISNPVKPLNIYKEWVNRVFQEFFSQGDKERDRGLKISYLCDRHTVNIIEAQIGFIDNIVFPLFDSMSIAFPNIKMITNLICNNKEEFKAMKERGEKVVLF